MVCNDMKNDSRKLSRIFAKRCLRRLFRSLWRIRFAQSFLISYWPNTELRIGEFSFLLGIWANLADRKMYISKSARSILSVTRLTTLAVDRRALIFDIGANVGTFAIPLAATVGNGSKIIAFEPNPRLAARLRENLQLNELTDNVIVEEVALGDEAGEMPLYTPGTNLGAASLHALPGSRSISVPVIPLVEYMPDSINDFQYFAIKIDVEGYEDQVLLPFLSALSSERLPNAIMTEVSHSDRWKADLIEKLHELGYKSFFVGEDGNALFLKLS